MNRDNIDAINEKVDRPEKVSGIVNEERETRKEKKKSRACIT
jgi:hypothetical protein